jgi:serine/threonine protein kinase
MFVHFNLPLSPTSEPACAKELLAAFTLRAQDVGVNELASGTLLEHYKIVRRLGQGGMGVVYEAVDQKLGRHVAVKLLTATRDSSAALERFWREARAASSLNYPGICTIHELNESADTPFIVMELLEQRSQLFSRLGVVTCATSRLGRSSEPD